MSDVSLQRLCDYQQGTTQTIPDILSRAACGEISLAWHLSSGWRLRELELRAEDDGSGMETEWRPVRVAGAARFNYRTVEAGCELFRLNMKLFPELPAWFANGCSWAGLQSDAEINPARMCDMDTGKVWEIVIDGDPFDGGPMPRIQDLRVILSEGGAPMPKPKQKAQQQDEWMRAWFKQRQLAPHALPPYRNGTKDTLKAACKEAYTKAGFVGFDKAWHRK